MRFDTPIYFRHTKPGAYDPETGDYAEDEVVEEMRFASVTNTGADTLRLVYGELKQSSLTLRLQTPYKGAFDSIRIGSKVFRVDRSRALRRLHTFVVSEVQAHA